ncbi:helix-turn-helix domain-containing protein [Streptomyces rectiverticillatus]|uniref:GlxA family transcriptional regulator n=1 Tax=Streptomyces rectiverticillatus TaxID=173860 RepID=UPI0015C2DD12|nr:helix-turn-helix domain-containing protein [Streptomyces rectiverticillatus]QLE75442.1 helix-turn-helix domain-containing protein [Streptomyces rectiverticillatus]
MHVVAILAPDDVAAFDLTIPCEVFALARRPDGTPAYELRVCAERTVTASAGAQQPFRISSRYRLDDARDADTVIVPGVRPDRAPSPRILGLIRDAAARGARVASICTGAFVLAAAGLLDGRRATTHWMFADRLAGDFPDVEVDPSVLFVDNGRILTSAGIAAGLDLCLHMVRSDLGAAAAARTARMIVMAPQRAGGQAQFIEYSDPVGDADDLGPTMQWMQDNLDRPLTVADIAAQAVMSPRTLARRFRAHTGTTPLQWLLNRRLQRARELLETTDLPMDRVAAAAGFGSTETLRHHFTRHIGTTPKSYRATFKVAVSYA